MVTESLTLLVKLPAFTHSMLKDFRYLCEQHKEEWFHGHV